MDLLAAMRTFRRVVERDSFSQAAADLGQSTAAVSKQVRQLEARLGALLILRTTRRMSLSETGARLLCRMLPPARRVGCAGAGHGGGRRRRSARPPARECAASTRPQGAFADPGGIRAWRATRSAAESKTDPGRPAAGRGVGGFDVSLRIRSR
ncbi:LysR family transcriptional regulator [Cupriavidus basilensis]